MDVVATHVDADTARALLCGELDVAGALIANTAALPEDVLRAFDLPRDACLRAAVTVAPAGNSLVLWRGNLARLCVDAVVNARHGHGVGCLRPEHRCVDNVLHRAAGPRLREAVRAGLAGRRAVVEGSGAAVGNGGGDSACRLDSGNSAEPLVTPGFNLPARWVLHVTGPRVRPPRCGATHAEALKSLGEIAEWYTRCVAVAATRGWHTLAFPCLAGGLHTVSPSAAADVAVTAVQAAQHAAGAAAPTVVVCVFSATHEAAYAARMGLRTSARVCGAEPRRRRWSA